MERSTSFVKQRKVMKKTKYIKPMTDIHAVITEKFICNSKTTDSASIGGTGSPNEKSQDDMILIQVVLVKQEARRIHSPSKTQLISGKIKTIFFTVD